MNEHSFFNEGTNFFVLLSREMTRSAVAALTVCRRVTGQSWRILCQAAI